MHIAFIHRAFPGQFRYVAPMLARKYGWQCTFVTSQADVPPPTGVAKLVYRTREPPSNNHIAAPIVAQMDHAFHVYDRLRDRSQIHPDAIVAHGSFGATLFLPYLYDAPIINFFEYFHRPVGQDIGYRLDEPVTDAQLLKCRVMNAMTLLDLEFCERAWCPSEFQRRLMPSAYHDKIDVIHDGIDTATFRRDTRAPRRLPDDTPIDRDTRVVTYVSRGFEMVRGFDVFMDVARRVYEQFPNVLFVVAGSDRVFYGNESQRGGEANFRARILKQGAFDLSKFRFVGKLSHPKLARLLSISDLHIYLTVPFFASWSVLEAMSSSCVVLASDQPCTRDFMTHGTNGLLCDFFDVEGMAEQAVEVLRDPGAFRSLGEAARQTIEEKFSIDVALPRIKSMFERVAAMGPRRPSLRKELLVRPARQWPVADVREPLPA